MADAVTGVFCINTATSRVHNLASGDAIQYVVGGTHDGSGVIRKASELDNGMTISGIVFALPNATAVASIGGPLKDGTAVWSTAQYSHIGDPAESQYTLHTGDVEHTVNVGTTAGYKGTEMIKNGSAQKFVNAVLDGAFRAYTSGVDHGSGITSMTVSRGDLSLSNTSVTDGTGVVNTYTRSYTVNFKYYQSGAITSPDNGTAARPDIAGDGSDGVPF